MIIGGLQKLSLLDYPDHLAAIVFTQGCNLRCHFCYNPQLVVPAPHRSDEVRTGAGTDYNSSDGSEDETQKGHLIIKEDGLFEFLKSRQGKLEAVVITGGEPTMHPDLPEFIARIKQLNYLVKLDTNGVNPEMLQSLIDEKLIDYIAMDIKAPLDKYEKVAGIEVTLSNIEKSIIIIRESGLPYEFRTTLAPGLLNKDDIEKIGKLIQGADRWYLQKFKSDTKLLDSSLQNNKPYTQKEMEEMREIGKKYVKHCEVR